MSNKKEEKTKGHKCIYCGCWTNNEWFTVCNAGYCHDCPKDKEVANNKQDEVSKM